MAYAVEKVENKAQIRRFHELPFALYKRNPLWIPHLKQDVEKVFDASKNKAFRGGEAQRWLLLDSSGRDVGRVAAFYNQKTAKSFAQPTGGLGFFECIEDVRAAFTLFDCCKAWLQEKGMEAMDGPINFGEKNAFWGLLVDGYEHQPAYQINYNPPYYQDFFESYGFKTYYEQYVFWRRTDSPAQEIFVRKAEMLKFVQGFEVRTVRGVSEDQLARDFLAVYNEAWGKHAGFSPMKLAQAQAIMKAIKPVKDPEISLFAFYKDKPIGFYINLPELNQIFKYVRGNLNLWGKLLFLWHKWRRTPHTMYGIVFGIVPEWQGKGVEGAMIKYAEDHIVPKGQYVDTIITWIGDFNLKMLRICENLNAQKQRTLITYRYLFDREKPFERHPFIGKK
jgi:GNAT superfamily N-acetyltransferase